MCQWLRRRPITKVPLDARTLTEESSSTAAAARSVDLQTLRMIGAYRGRQETPEFGPGFYFGVYAETVTPGRIAVGDELRLLD